MRHREVDPLWIDPTDEARLLDPQHPIHHGLVLHPVPNLIVTRGNTPGRTRMSSRWMFKTVVFVHYTPLQKFLYVSGVIVLLLALICMGLVIGTHGGSDAAALAR